MSCAVLGVVLLAMSVGAASPTWTYDNSAKTLTSTDGWSFGVASWAEGKLTLKGQNAGSTGSGVLDLTLVGSAAGRPCDFKFLAQSGNNIRAFAGADAVLLPDSVTELGDWALRGASLPGAHRFPSVSRVGKGAFSGCDQLTSLDIGTTNVYAKIGNDGTQPDHSPIYGCSSLTSVTVRASSIQLNGHAFSGNAAVQEIRLLQSGKVQMYNNYQFQSATGLKAVHIGGTADSSVPTVSNVFSDRGDAPPITILLQTANTNSWATVLGAKFSPAALSERPEVFGKWTVSGSSAYLAVEPTPVEPEDDPPVVPPTPSEGEDDPVKTNLTFSLYAPIDDEAATGVYCIRAAALKAGAKIDAQHHRPSICGFTRVVIDGSSYWQISVSNVCCGMVYALCAAESATETFEPVADAAPAGESTGMVVHSDGTIEPKAAGGDEPPDPVYSQIVFALTGCTAAYDGREHTVETAELRPTDSTVTYATAKDGHFTATKPTRTEAGATTVYAKAEHASDGPTNYVAATAEAEIRVTQAENRWMERPSLSKSEWRSGETGVTVSQGCAKWGEVKANYTTSTLPTAAGDYTASFMVEACANWSGLDEVKIPFKVLSAEDEPDPGPEPGETVELECVFGGAVNAIFRRTAGKGAEATVDFGNLVSGIGVTAAAASVGAVSGAVLTVPAAAMSADLSVHVALRGAPSAPAQPTASGWTTRLADADMNGDGVIKVLALGHSYTEDAVSYFYDTLQQLKALGETRKLVYCNTFSPGCPMSKYMEFLDQNKADIKISCVMTDDVPDSERPTLGGQTLPALTGAWGDAAYANLLDCISVCDDWDVVILQDSVFGMCDANTLRSYKAKLVSALKNRGCKTADGLKFGWYMTWAFAQGWTGENNDQFNLNYKCDTAAMYAAIVKSVGTGAVTSGLVDFVIPQGTSLQNLRSLESHNTANAADCTVTSRSFERDSTDHLDFICGRWTAALTYLGALGFDVSAAYFPNERKYKEDGGSVFRMRPEQETVSRACVMAALAEPTKVSALPWTAGPCELECGAGGSHAYGAAKTVAKTCTADGCTERTCSGCGFVLRTDWVPASHEDLSAVTAPSCTAYGYTTHVCAICGKTYTTDSTRPLGHAYAAVTNVAECSVAYKCTRCGNAYEKVYNHLVEEWTVTREPTWTEPGERQGGCVICGAAVVEEVPVLNNNVEYHWDFAHAADADAALANLTRFSSSRSALTGQLEYDAAGGALRYWSLMDFYMGDKWASARINKEHVNSSRGFLLKTPADRIPSTFRLRGRTGKPLQPEKDVTRACPEPGVVFAQDDKGLYAFQVTCTYERETASGAKETPVFQCRVSYQPFKSQDGETVLLNDRQSVLAEAQKIVEANGRAVSLSQEYQKQRQNLFNYLASSLGYFGGFVMSPQQLGFIDYTYEVTVLTTADGSPKFQISSRADYDRDGDSFSAIFQTRTFTADNLKKANGATHSTAGLRPVFGMWHCPFYEAAKELVTANDAGYNATDVTAVDAVYVEEPSN